MSRDIELRNDTFFVSTSDFQKHCTEMIERYVELKRDYDNVVNILKQRNCRCNGLEIATQADEGFGLSFHQSICSQSSIGSYHGAANLGFKDFHNVEANNGAKSCHMIDVSLGITINMIHN